MMKMGDFCMSIASKTECNYNIIEDSKEIITNSLPVKAEPLDDKAFFISQEDSTAFENLLGDNSPCDFDVSQSQEPSTFSISVKEELHHSVEIKCQDFLENEFDFKYEERCERIFDNSDKKESEPIINLLPNLKSELQFDLFKSDSLVNQSIANEEKLTVNHVDHEAAHANERNFKCTFSPERCIDEVNLKLTATHFPDRENHICDVCKKSCKNRQSLKSHLITHNDTRSFQCPICSYKCKRKPDLKKHQARHANKRRYEYAFCSKKFNCSYELRSHVAVHTSSVDEYACDVCKKIFKKKDSLLLHLKFHKGPCIDTGSFQCPICPYKCKRKQDLNRHQARHANQRHFECTICSLRFNCSNGLCVHETIHKRDGEEYTCDVCKKIFKGKNSLILHLKFHDKLPNDTRSFQCPICPYKWKPKPDLNRHQAIHANERLFECNFCSKRFNCSDYLRRHVAVHKHDGEGYS